MIISYEENTYLAQLTRQASNGIELSGFEALAVLNWIDPTPGRENRNFVNMLANMAGLPYETAKSIAAGEKTDVEMDGLQITLHARETTFQGVGL